MNVVYDPVYAVVIALHVQNNAPCHVNNRDLGAWTNGKCLAFK